jgi:hypothetical protein
MGKPRGQAELYEESKRVVKPRSSRDRVFLNIPYDKKFERLFLAYIAGISAFGMVPHATLEIPDSSRRLDKILRLERRCKYSVHDLSRVELDRMKPRTPRFNMPFELGLCVADAKGQAAKRQNWFVFESHDNRLDKSLSDLKGTDARIHGGRVRGVFGELCNVFVRSGRQPTVQQMARIYRELRQSQKAILRGVGVKTLYSRRVFSDICVAASKLADEIVV